MCQGHDIVILEDLIGTEWRPPVMWIEWFMEYKFIKPDERFLDVPSNMLGFLEVRKWCKIMLLIYLEEQEQLTLLLPGWRLLHSKVSQVVPNCNWSWIRVIRAGITSQKNQGPQKQVFCIRLAADWEENIIRLDLAEESQTTKLGQKIWNRALW